MVCKESRISIVGNVTQMDPAAYVTSVLSLEQFTFLVAISDAETLFL